MTELVTINTDNYATMAKAMGIAIGNSSTVKKANNLNRLRIWHSPVMGKAEVNGKTKNVEVVDGGTYRLEVLEHDTSTYYYAKTATVRPYMQRYMYRRYIANTNAKDGEPKGVFHRTIMSDSLSVDLKDNQGTFNCGKPTGFVEDFKSLPTDMQDLIRQIKRVRVVFGTIKLDNPLDEKGKEVVIDEMPFIWEIDNKDAYGITKNELSPLVFMVSEDEESFNPDLKDGNPIEKSLPLKKFIDENYSKSNLGNLPNSAAFFSDRNEIINDSYQLKNKELISIIPPIGGG